MLSCDNHWYRKNISAKRRRKFQHRRKSANMCWCHYTKKEHFHDKDWKTIIIPKSREESILLKKSKDFILCDIFTCGRQFHCSKRYYWRKDHDEEVMQNKKYIREYKNEFIIKPKTNKLVKEKVIEKEKSICSICYDCSDNLKYINCKRKGIQNINFGKFSKCCKDKAICQSCLERCKDNCPFCRKHRLLPVTRKYGKKKLPFALRKKVLIEKKKKKQVSQERSLSNRERSIRMFDYRDYIPVSNRNSTSETRINYVSFYLDIVEDMSNIVYDRYLN